jgi:hypothetical protein
MKDNAWESKVDKGQPDFSRGVDVLAHTPNPRCDTHKEYCHLPSHQDEGAH